MLPAKQLLAKFSSVDQLLQTPLRQQDNWYQYMDKSPDKSLFERPVTVGESPYMKNYTFQFSYCFIGNKKKKSQRPLNILENL